MERSKSKLLLEKYGRYLFRATSTREIVIKSADGCYIRDMDGNSYLDMTSGVWCAILGHSHPKHSQAVVEQTNKIVYIAKSFWGYPVLEAAEACALVDMCLEDGVFFDFAPWSSVFRILPALTISDQEIEKSLQEIGRAHV